MCEYVWLWIARVTSQVWPVTNVFNSETGGRGWPCVAWSRHLFIVDRKYWDKSKIDLVDTFELWMKQESKHPPCCYVRYNIVSLFEVRRTWVVNLKWKCSLNWNKLICAFAIYMLCCCYIWSQLQIAVKSNFSYI